MKAKFRFNKAAVDGLLLAAVTIILSLIKDLFSAELLTFLVWLIKLVVTMFVLYYFMKKNTELNTKEGMTTTYSDAFKYGFLISLFSVIIITAYTFFSFQLMDSAELMDSVEAVLSDSPYYNSGDATGEATLNWMLNNMGTFALISTFVMYAIWSAIASAIFAGKCKSKNNNPFTDNDSVDIS